MASKPRKTTLRKSSSVKSSFKKKYGPTKKKLTKRK